jgi:hypothetical protein
LFSLDDALTMPAYKESFPVGTRVQIAPCAELEQFRETWRFHHPLQLEQLTYAAREATVSHVAFYHGGDALYTLTDIPGLWHECCVHAPDNATRNI